ncbi:hypothetical protein WSM22_23850 [Cytophagales bacterium WSM2-2]|nr:hypothetical protein WSM22_23850 [Cytophagales bacterium WSM2-2]
MSCKDFETNIYVYDELSQSERTQLDIHLKTCLHCSALFQEIKQVQHLVSSVASEKPQPPHAARLTGTIMTKITKPVSRSWIEHAYDFLVSQRARYALTALSSGLVILFCIQSFDDTTPVQKPQSASLANTVILNAKLFGENFSHNREKRALFADCRSPFQSSRYYVNCVKSKLK